VDVPAPADALAAPPARPGALEGTSSELPACRLRRVTQYIQENLQGELGLGELSALVHMSPYHFARLFKRSTGYRRIDTCFGTCFGAGSTRRKRYWRLERCRSPRWRGWWDFGRRVTSRPRFGGSPRAYRSGAGASGAPSTSVVATADTIVSCAT
jgi:hypothetical protein